MGIKDLSSYVQGHSMLFEHSDPRLKTKAIIDGSAFAHEAVRWAKQAVEGEKLSQIPYQAINEAAAKWLSELELGGFEIAFIYFDGALPKAKRATRESRLAQGLAHITKFKTRYGAGTTTPILPNLDSYGTPFAPVSVRRHLECAGYADRVHVVPGEADDWVAEACFENPGSVIFTNDSDFLLHEIGSSSTICLFRDLPQRLNGQTGDTLKVYHPPTIARKLDVGSDLVALGYVLHNPIHKHAQPQQRLRLARNMGQTDLLKKFRSEYSRQHTSRRVLNSMDLISQYGIDKVMKELDPRVSELAVAFASINHSPETAGLTAEMFLPFLIEHPTKTAAWKQGISGRVIGYSLIFPQGIQDRVVTEYARTGDTIGRLGRKLVQPTELAGEVEEFTERMNAALHGPVGWMWRAMVAADVLRDMTDNQFSSICTAMVTQAVQGDCGFNWDSIHLKSQIDAGVYSLRILYQCCRLFLDTRLGEWGQQDPRLVAAVERLRAALVQLPPIEDMAQTREKMDAYDRAHQIQLHVERFMTDIRIDRGIHDGPKRDRRQSWSDAKSHKSKKSKKEKQGMAAAVPVDPRNQFALLASLQHDGYDSAEE